MAITRIIGWMVAVFLIVGSGPGPLLAAQPEPQAQGAPVRVTEIDFDECEPVHLRAAIMEINAARGIYVVAEREIRLMDLASSKRTIKTAFLNIEGKPEPVEGFEAGQYVSIKGFGHPDGFVAAESIQKILKPETKGGGRKPAASAERRNLKTQPRAVSSPGGRK